MKEKLEPILHVVLGALRDPEEMVRGAASFALGQFAEYLQPEIVSHYESVLPCILSALDDISDEVKEKSYYALAAFCENMSEEILPYLDPLMGKLLDPSKIVLSAIGSVASAAEQAFIPYAEKGFGLEFSELREYTHGFSSNIAEIMDGGFAQYLPRVVPLAFSSCNLDIGSAVDVDESDDESRNGFGGVSSDDEAHNEPRVRNISIRTGVLDEKAAATQALGMFALHTKTSYAQYPLCIAFLPSPSCFEEFGCN
ncbi:hypothetical protein K2173_009278 [Erythroxylum novogranatense]|uniref:Uncharacterized protein n=1 Tax=Erythroxylum novogranatense TaxID=1862640 RepID=A0AAV8SZQ0_9ROSI|nr:hypothetical protein K2173_009278 [Erythroxylum novogranatense]